MITKTFVLLVALTAATVCFTGCQSVDITKTAKGFHAPTNPNEVEILMTRPDKAYEELGTINATGFLPSETAKMHNALRAKAAPLGANAVVVGNLANEQVNPQHPQYEPKIVANEEPLIAKSDEQGRIWIFVGTDSAFEGPSKFYVAKVTIGLEVIKDQLSISP